ncbi:DUF3426 domain-containing protein [Methylophilus sp.]|jgi:predicted Zn finger-like uncharacterized protein|uniref:DUF3426 domain-containing protein n=1 Tax=Methylophilus sp. TaxID=29541 RepID=UPI0011DB8FD9|nr:DUF3426 domain-containing protein [Methylophilus sp.]TXI44490.1 MAG: DUF3426 domain-containing protein [Methylophilus sp.]
MSLITACPACQTQFEVTDEQLQAYAGKVRCGECDHVFDARSHLVESTAAALAVADTSDVASDAAVYFKVSAEVAHADNTAAVPDFSVRPDLPLDDDFSPTLRGEAHDAVDASPAIPAFLRDIALADERPALPTSPASQRVFIILSAVLVLLLILQSTYFTRVSLAATYPQTKPLLQALCKPLHCEVSVPRDIAQLTIDDADIQEHKERQGVLIFSSVLMNHGTVAQAYPQVELTLTNTADEPVLRKTLHPAEYLPASVNVAAGLAPQQEQAVKALLGVDEKLVTGFRVAIAY